MKRTKEDRIRILIGIGVDLDLNYFAQPQWRLDIIRKAMEEDRYKYRNANCTSIQCYYFSLQNYYLKHKEEFKK